MATPQRAMQQHEETIYRESKAVSKWRDRYGHPPAEPNSNSHSCMTIVVIMGHPLLEDGSMDPILKTRVERGAEHWHGSPTSTCVVCTSADKSMYPDAADGVTEAIKHALVHEHNVPPEVVYTRADGLTTYHQAEDVHRWLTTEPKARCSLLKLVTSDFNIVRAKRCFRKLFSIYISEDECVSGMRGEELLFQMDREHHLVREYRLENWL